MIKVIIADDHRLVRRGLSALLGQAAEVEVVGEAKNGKEAVEMTTRLQPDVLVMDISMPEMTGIEALQSLPHDSPPVLFLSMHEEYSLVERALAAGAAGYVLKRAAPTELLTGIHSVYAGDGYLSKDLRRRQPS